MASMSHGTIVILLIFHVFNFKFKQVHMAPYWTVKFYSAVITQLFVANIVWLPCVIKTV